jgi:hypothetical protein
VGALRRPQIAHDRAIRRARDIGAPGFEPGTSCSQTPRRAGSRPILGREPRPSWLLAPSRRRPVACIVVGDVLVPLVIGALAGWWSLPLTTAAFVLATILYQLVLWPDDPELTGIDDLPPLAGILFVLPWLLLLVAFGATLRQWRLGRPRDDG